jgi:hypothetical protein
LRYIDVDFDPYNIAHYAHSYILLFSVQRYSSSASLPCGYLMGRIDPTSVRLVSSMYVAS